MLQLENCLLWMSRNSWKGGAVWKCLFEFFDPV
jgi:hypothetical protein